MPYKNIETKRAHSRRWSKQHPGYRRAEKRIYWGRFWCKKHAAYIRAWRKKNPEKTRVYDYTRRMKRDGGDISTIRPKPKDGRCQRCRKKARLSLDHDHKTGCFRGWLCHKCNGGIGMLGDTLRDIIETAAYLRRAMRRAKSRR